MILDTNALSAIADDRVAIRGAFRSAVSIEIPAIVLGEYGFGILQSRHRERYEHFLEMTLLDCKVLAVDAATAVHYGRLRYEMKRAGTPLPVNDLWIAALCLQYEKAILSQDAHFDRVPGVRRVDW